MSKNIKTLFCSALALIIIVIGNYVIVAQSTLTGSWRAETKSEKPDKIYLSFERISEKGGRNQMGTNYDYSDLKGLSREQSLSSGPVKFSLVREAGTIDCEGIFQNGKGSGTFVFTPNQGFIDAMKTRGFDFEKSSKYNDEPLSRVFSATTLNVTTALADDLLSANLGKLDVEDLFKAAIFKVDSNFISEMKNAGFGNLGMEELVKARIFKVDGAFASEMKASGFPNLGMEELVKARIFKIDADFVRQVAGMGFNNEPFESLVKMRIFKVTPEFITEVRNEGLTNLDVESLVKMRIFKIDGAFIRQARADGVPLEVEKLVQKRIGVWGK